MAPQLAILRQSPGILRVIMLLLSAVGIIFISVGIALHDTSVLIGYELSVVPLISVVTYGWTVAWSISAICVLLFHGPYPAGVDIGLDFLGWGFAWGLAVALNMNMVGGYGGTTGGKALMALEILASIFAYVYGACHLFLFVSAIKRVVTNRRAGPRKSMDLEVQSGST